MTSPCYQCNKRSVQCHSRCEKYLAYSKERERLRLLHHKYVETFVYSTKKEGNIRAKLKGK